MIRRVAALLALALCVGAAHERSGATITSTAEPAVRVTVPSSSAFVGRDHFALFGIADCDLFVYVDADAARHVKRLYWIQFEGYLPAYPRLAHVYGSPERTTISGLPFFVDEWPHDSAQASPPHYAELAKELRSRGYAVPEKQFRSGSDEQHVFALLRDRGYVMPAQRASVRLVHLEPGARRELMIIYSEAVSGNERHALLADALARIHLRTQRPGR